MIDAVWIPDDDIQSPPFNPPLEPPGIKTIRWAQYHFSSIVHLKPGHLDCRLCSSIPNGFESLFAFDLHLATHKCGRWEAYVCLRVPSDLDLATCRECSASLRYEEESEAVKHLYTHWRPGTFPQRWKDLDLVRRITEIKPISFSGPRHYPEEIERNLEGIAQSSLISAPSLRSEPPNDVSFATPTPAERTMNNNEAFQLGGNLNFDIDALRESNDGPAAQTATALGLITGKESKDLRLTYTHVVYAQQSHVPFDSLSVLGQGSFSRVEKVRSKTSGAIFACKMFRLSASTRHQYLPLVQKEVAVVKSLTHPHIITVNGTYEAPRMYAIIMSPVADEDLETFLERTAESGYPLADIDHLIKWLGCLTRAVAYIHAQGIRHKDIKPKNIVCKGSEIYLTDFGSSHQFAAELTSSTEGHAYGNTKMYSAPEVIAGEVRGRSADIFSLGCVFAEMCTTIEERSVMDFYRHREADGSHAFHATLPKVHSWFKIDDVMLGESGRARPFAPMLSADRQHRPSALEVARYIDKWYLYLSHCQRCEDWTA